MPGVELSAGMIDYEDTQGSGPVIVLLHGLVMNGAIWQQVVQDLRNDYRCVFPTLPLGAHQRPLQEDADLSAQGIAKLQSEFLQALDLHNVTLVGNDTGHFQLTAGLYPERIARLVITPCEAFENFPPGLPGRTAELGIRLPGGAFLLAQALRWHPLRRLPLTFGWMAKKPIPDEMIDTWLHPLQTQAAIRRDLRKYVCSMHKNDMLVAAEALRNFDGPALVVWTREDPVMVPSYGRRFADLLSQGHLIEIADSYALIPLDQPATLAQAIRQFIQTSS